MGISPIYFPSMPSMVWKECSPVDERVLLIGEYMKGVIRHDKARLFGEERGEAENRSPGLRRWKLGRYSGGLVDARARQKEMRPRVPALSLVHR